MKTLKSIRVAENYVCVTFASSEGSAHNDPSFFCWLSYLGQKFSRLKKIASSSARHLSWCKSNLDLIKRVSFLFFRNKLMFLYHIRLISGAAVDSISDCFFWHTEILRNRRNWCSSIVINLLMNMLDEFSFMRKSMRLECF